MVASHSGPRPHRGRWTSWPDTRRSRLARLAATRARTIIARCRPSISNVKVLAVEPKRADEAAPRQPVTDHLTAMLQHGVEAGPNVLPAQFAGVGLGALLDVLGDWTAVLFVTTDGQGVLGLVAWR
jgi:hypothetical protein